MENSYDDIISMLSKIRKIQDKKLQSKFNKMINEQVEEPTPETQEQSPEGEVGKENTDFTVINNLEVVINSTDQNDLTLGEDEKSQISRVVDDFHAEVDDMVEFGKLILYRDSAKLNGKLTAMGIDFLLVGGADSGLYLTNMSMLKIDTKIMEMVERLKGFMAKFDDTMSELIQNRTEN